jgi:hypothetical protein
MNSQQPARVPLADEIRRDIQAMWANAGVRWKFNHNTKSFGESGGCHFDGQFTKKLADWNERYCKASMAIPALSAANALANEVPPSTVPSFGDGSLDTALNHDMSYPVTQRASYVMSSYTGDEHASFPVASNSGRFLSPAPTTGRLDLPANRRQCEYSARPWWNPGPPCRMGQSLLPEMETEISNMEGFMREQGIYLFGCHDKHGCSFAEECSCGHLPPLILIKQVCSIWACLPVLSFDGQLFSDPLKLVRYICYESPSW